MKKVFAILLMLVLALGCSATMAQAEPGETDFALTLTANPSTGYDWIYVLSEDGVVTVEQEVITSADIDKLAGIEPAEPMPGEGSFYIYTIKGVKPGDVLIALEYQAAGDENDAYAGLTYMLHVNDDLSVVCVGSTLGI